MNRREFIGDLAAVGLCGGCTSWPAFARTPMPPNYFFSWGNQCYCTPKGVPGRDNLDEKVLFGEKGWAREEFPEDRGDLFFLIDDSWDYPKGIDMKIGPIMWKNYGRCEMDPGRFPSFKGTPGQRLAQYTKAVCDLGWRGSGIWVSPTSIDAAGKPLSQDPFAAKEARSDWYRKISWMAEGNIGYLKVDWGTFQHTVPFRALMTELKNELCPDMVIEHAINQNPFNGVYGRYDDVLFGEPRLFGNAEAERRYRKEAVGLLACSDVVRIYDINQRLRSAVGIERTTWLLELAEATGGTAYLSVEDDVMLAASLGCTFGTGRSKFWSDNYRHRMFRRNEVRRALAWQRLAPAFRPTKALATRHSSESLTDTGRARDVGHAENLTKAFGGEKVWMIGPAVVARGMELPKVRPDAGGDRPFTVAARYANGAVSLGALERAKFREGPYIPRCDISLGVAPGKGAPLGLFGDFASVTLPMAKCRVRMGDVMVGALEDVTAACTFSEGQLVIPGDLVRGLGRQGSDAQDESMAGAVVYFG